MLLTKTEIKELIKKYDEISYAEEGTELFGKVNQNIKNLGYLTKQDFLKIVRWKAVRAIRKAEANSEEVIENITKFAFGVENEEVKIRVLTSLNGVSVPMASAILTVFNPDKYGVIDIRAWHSLCNLGELQCKKDIYNFQDWILYLNTIRKLARQNNVSPREIDMALFMYDKLNRVEKLYK